MGSRPSRIAWVGQLIAVAVPVALGVWIWLEWDQDRFLSWQQEAGIFPFFTALAVMPALGFPTTPFYLLAGATFGVMLGLVGSALSLAINLALCYWITQSGLRPMLETWLAHTRYQLPVVRPGHEIEFTLLAKLIPGIPTFIKNYLICLSGVSFPIYFAVSFTVTLAYASAFIVLGDSLYEHDFSEALLALAMLALIGLMVWLIRCRLKQNKDSADDP
jgi:uncharacterized membrane protein YdjX (TVP38/TMEM64 family)